VWSACTPLLLLLLLLLHCSFFHCSARMKGDTSTRCTCQAWAAQHQTWLNPTLYLASSQNNHFPLSGGLLSEVSQSLHVNKQR
jgi:hypothetical protein